MTYGRNPQIDHEMDWVIDEEGNLLGYMKDEKTLVMVGSGVGTVNGLKAGDSSLATALANTNLLQSALNSRGFVKIPPGLGTVYFAPGLQSNDYGILLADDYTLIDIGIGTELTQLPYPQVTSPVISNLHARGNKMTVTSVVAAGQDSQGKYTIVNVTIPGHSFVKGGFILLKGDTTGYYNRVWEVQAVASNVVTIHCMGYEAFPNGAGSIIAYKANAFITIKGEGCIGGAYNLTNGTIGYVNLCMVLFNKVKACAYRVRSTKSYQRGCQFVNFYDCEAGGADQVITIESGAVGVQVTGPGDNINIGNIYGGNADDKVAVLTYDVTGAQFYDADGTLNSGGDIGSVDIHHIYDHGNSTRSVMLGADGGRFDSVKVSSLHRRHRGSGQGVEAEVLNGGVFGQLTIEDAELLCHGKGGMLLGLTGAATSTNGGGVYESIDLVRPVMRAGVGGGLQGACETSLVKLGSNNYGTIKSLRVHNPSIHYDLANSANEVEIFSGGNTSRWAWEKVQINGSEITFTGTNGRIALWAVGLSNDLEASLTGGRIKSRASYGFFVSSGRTYKINLCDLTVTGMNDLVSGNGQAIVNTFLCDLTGMGTGQDGALVRTYGAGTSGARLKHTISSAQTRFGNTFVTGGLGAYTDVNYRSGGGNTSTQVTPFYNGVNNDGGVSNNNGYYLFGDCSDWSIKLDKIARNAGAIVTVNTAIGTILANNLAVCDATATTNSWKQLSNTSLVY